MSKRSSDQEIATILAEQFGDLGKRVTYHNSNITKLDLQGLDLSDLPPEIFRLTNLHELKLGRNKLKELSSEIGQLASLRKLMLQENHLAQLPSEISQLTRLQELHLDGNRLTQLAPEIGQLTKLQEISLSHTELTQLPPEIGQLTNLRKINLFDNHLTQLPPEIGRLTNLYELELGNNDLTQLLPEIFRLTSLQYLGLQNSHLMELPPEISQLTNLRKLSLYGNRLTHLPPEIGQLTNLLDLGLHTNRLTHLPPEIGQLTNLQEIYLGQNRLTHLPPEIGQLANLRKLMLQGNPLIQLPSEISQLTNLEELRLIGNPDLLTPPPEVTTHGRVAVLNFLQELQRNSIIRYEAKLLVVGEGGTGKSSLLRSLRDDFFNPHLFTTHGIEVDFLHLPHPQSQQTEITLNTWDFGGQHIYHATHQFFLTKRSLYLVVWNARLGAEQGRLHFWLETIKALAPDALVLLVATHIDERAPDLNYQLYLDAYPQLVGNFNVSNKDKTGLDELKIVLARYAVKIRLMGQPWPQRWLEADQRLLALPDHHIDARTYIDCCVMSNIEADIARGTLGNYLHDLGKILYFRDDPVLSNLVVLKPNWVTKAISRVLTDEPTSKAHGIFSHSELPRIWATDVEGHSYDSHLYPVFLRLMERFDLSYQIDPERPGSPSTRSLVPQLLPHQPPANLPPWPNVPSDGQTHVEMWYQFDFLPSGIMPWFIVRTHRYTQNLHWREGVILKYQNHQARVELNPMRRELRLAVWGVQPHNFFTILMNTLDLILERFEGLQVQREVPCICHWQGGTNGSCPRFYRYEDLVDRMNVGKREIECPGSYIYVSVPELLYGIHTSTNEQVIADIKHGQQQLLQGQQRVLHDLSVLPEMVRLLQEVNQRSELIWRAQLRQWNFEMQKLEAECPNTFFLTLGDMKHFNPKNWVSDEYRLYLICQHPSGPHQVGEGYSIREEKELWTKLRPWLNHLITILKVGIPMGRAIGAVYDEFDLEHMNNQIALMEEVTKNLPEINTLDTLSDAVTDPHLQQDYQAVGSALRALHIFLTQVDSSHIWGGLSKTVTPDGNILWLCDTHRQQYEIKPLDKRYTYSS